MINSAMLVVLSVAVFGAVVAGNEAGAPHQDGWDPTAISDLHKDFINGIEGHEGSSRGESGADLMFLRYLMSGYPHSTLPGERSMYRSEKRANDIIRYHQCYFNPISCFRRR